MIRIAGVPEHFNYPWKLLAGQESSLPNPLEWIDVPEGTGRMRDMLHTGEVDGALMLTEGAVQAIAGGLDARILQLYVETPLLWGVHLGYREGRILPEDLRGMDVAISRKGSGSHLMAVLYARSKGWDTTALRFVRVNTLEGARSQLSSHPECYFLWEKFTTQPFVDRKEFVRADVFPTPWPCFVWVCTTAAYQQKREEIEYLRQRLKIVLKECFARPELADEISKTYRLNKTEVEDWLSLTRWSTEVPAPELLSTVQYALKELELIDSIHHYSDFVF